MKYLLDIYTDGGSRGNPGPSASAFVVYSNGEEFASGSQFLGEATNNQAEYIALLMAVKWLAEKEKLNEIQKVDFYLDSELVTRQISGIYKIKNKTLSEIAGKVKNLLKTIKAEIYFHSVTRDKNAKADLLVNNCLDSHSDIKSSM